MLRDLKQFSFLREVQPLEHDDEEKSTALRVLDFDRNRQITLDTSRHHGRHPKDIKGSEAERILFQQVS